ncbi:MAG: hypothetical protein L3J51_12525 [Cocleimonas sp.]|nr:hypothetical protein [Cocleimonas sp.]
MLNNNWKRLTKVIFLAWLIALVSVSFPVSAEENILQKLEINEPRNFAYHIGDSLTRSIHIQLRKPYKLKTELLPKRKRMGRWLLVTSSEYKVKELEGSTQYDIELHYQIINIIPELKEVILPRHYLVYADSTLNSIDENKKKISRLEIPFSKVGVSSITKLGSSNIQPDKKPALLAQSNDKLLLYGSLLLATLAGLAMLLWGLPFSKKEEPFGEALFSLKKLNRKNWDEARYSKALKIIHQAFNTTAGKTVFIEKTDDFLDEHNQFLPLKTKIEGFFNDSDQHFFKGVDTSVTDKNKLVDLISFVQSCRKIEQGRM